VRYNVYCDEFNYEKTYRFADREEKDTFDSTSLHALISHKSSGMPAGCVRVVAPTGVEGEDQLPFEKYCGKSIDSNFLGKLNTDRSTVCEISRLAVDSIFRRRSVEKLTRFGEIGGPNYSQQERRAYALIGVAGIMASISMTDLTNRTNIFAMMEPFLLRILERAGINFSKAGAEIDYHGLRAPYFITTQEMIDNIHSDIRDFYKEIHTRIAHDFCKLNCPTNGSAQRIEGVTATVEC
jgi:N-acyl amino acid synthase of PEP-CTERM/exosortase system